MAGVELTSVYAGIAGGHIKGLNSPGMVAIREREVSDNDVERVLEAAQAIAIPPDREVLHCIPQEYIIDEQDGVKEPRGIEKLLFGSGAGDTKAKAEIWSDNAKFKAAAEKMQGEMSKLAVAAKSGNLDTLKAAFGPVGAACKACHEDFRKD